MNAFQTLFLPQKGAFPHHNETVFAAFTFCINCGKYYYMHYLFDVYGLQTVNWSWKFFWHYHKLSQPRLSGW